MFDKTIKETFLIDAAIPSSRSLLGTITEKLQKHTDLKGKLSRVWQNEGGLYNTISITRN